MVGAGGNLFCVYVGGGCGGRGQVWVGGNIKDTGYMGGGWEVRNCVEEENT